MHLKTWFTVRYKVFFFSRAFDSSFTFNLFKYFFPFLLFFVLPTIFLIINFFFSLEEKKAIYKEQLALAKIYDARLSDLSVYSHFIIEHQENYEQILGEIFENLANFSSDQNLWSEEKLEEITEKNIEANRFSKDHTWYERLFNKVNFKKRQMKKKDYEILLQKMQKVTIRTRETLEHLKDIDSYFSLRDHLKKDIPSGWPLQKKIGKVTSRYGPRYSPFSKKVEFHEGVDIGGVPLGSIIIATADGEVVFSGEKGGFGSVVILLHKYGHKTVYGHNRQLLVEVGERVKKGAPLAYIGSSGRSTGVHLHYEVRLKNKHMDPWLYVIMEF